MTGLYENYFCDSKCLTAYFKIRSNNQRICTCIPSVWFFVLGLCPPCADIAAQSKVKSSAVISFFRRLFIERFKILSRMSTNRTLKISRKLSSCKLITTEIFFRINKSYFLFPAQNKSPTRLPQLPLGRPLHSLSSLRSLQWLVLRTPAPRSGRIPVYPAIQLL